MGKSKQMVLIFVLISLMWVNRVISEDVHGKKSNYTKILLGPNQRGPEALAFDCKGEGPYGGISDGRILKWQGQQIGWTEYAATTPNRSSTCNGVYDTAREKECGRPLGLKFDPKTCELYVADSSVGLLIIPPKGGVATSLATSFQNRPFTFLNGLDIDFDNNLVYFTESSANYHRWEASQAMKTGDASGRLMKYDLKTKNVTVLLEHLPLANGVAVSKNKDFLLVAQTTTSKVVKFWLNGPKKGTSEVFQLKGRPDNIHINAKGDFWIALLDTQSIKVNEDVQVLDTLEGDEIVNPSDVQEFANKTWIGYVDQPFIYHT